MFDLSKFFSRKNTSKNVAKDRLKLVLIHDRANVNPSFLNTIKDEIMQVLRKYMNIGDEALDIHITSTESEDGSRMVPALVANIPIRDVKVNQDDDSKGNIA
jgi:cell division topological specificity factor